MSLFEIDPTTFELVRTDNEFVRISGLPEVKQGVHHRVNLIRGEARYAALSGVPHFEGLNSEYSIFTKGIPDDLIANMFGVEVAAVAGVETLEYAVMIQSDAQISTRKASIEYAATVSLDELSADVRLTEKVEIVTT